MSASLFRFYRLHFKISEYLYCASASLFTLASYCYCAGYSTGQAGRDQGNENLNLAEEINMKSIKTLNAVKSILVV